MSKNGCIRFLRTFIPGKALGLTLGLLTVIGFRANATPVTVQEVGTGPSEVVQMTSSTLGTHWVYAGALDLLVNGVATEGFCIDPFHWSIGGPQAYNTEALDAGPKAPEGPMGASTALKIEQLWSQYFSPGMGNENAAGLQIAIWELVGGSDFQLDSSLDYGAADMLAWVDNNPTAPAASLTALTGPGQDYAIPSLPSGNAVTLVPDGGDAVLLLGCGLLSLFILRAKFATRLGMA